MYYNTITQYLPTLKENIINNVFRTGKQFLTTYKNQVRDYFVILNQK